MAPNDEFRLYNPAASVPIQRPKLVTSYRTPDVNTGAVINGVLWVRDKARLVFNNIDIHLS